MPYVGPGFDLPLLRSGLLTHWWAAPPRDLLSQARDTLLVSDAQFREPTATGRQYVIALLDLALGDTAALQRAAARLETEGPDLALSRDLARALRAYHAARAGRPREALRRFEEIGPPGWFGYAVSGAASGDPLLRFVRAEALLALGRDDEALGWYGSFGEHALRDLAYLAPAHFRRGEILERRGQLAQARVHFARVVALWAGADAEFQPWVTAARARLGERLPARGDLVRRTSSLAPQSVTPR